MKKISKIVSTTVLICSILIPGSTFSVLKPVFNSNVNAAELEKYQRKHISFFQKDIIFLNNILQEAIQKSLPRFDYHLLGTALNIDIMSFLKEVKQYQKEHAGEIASKGEKENTKFKDVVVPWSETKVIMESAYVFSPNWEFTKTEVIPPTKRQDLITKREYWAANVLSNLNLKIDIYKLKGDTPIQYATIEQTWSLTKEIEVKVKESNDLVELAAAIKKAMDESKEIQKALNTDPKTYFMPIAEDLLKSENSAVVTGGLAFVANNIKKLEDFILKGEIMSVDMTNDKANIGFGDKETPNTLGVLIDDGYKIVEYKTVGDKEEKVEVGYSKVRKITEKEVITQPIIVGRDYEIGDQTIEYPKVGSNILLRFGMNNFTIGGKDVIIPAMPNLGLDLEYDFGRYIEEPELYLSLGIDMNLIPSSLSHGYDTTTSSDNTTKIDIMSGIAEIGVFKKLYLRQFILNAGVRLGSLYGWEIKDQKNSTYGVGGTLLVGAHYLINPDMILGLDTGYRFYTQVGDDLKSGNTSLPKIGSNGPIVSLFINGLF